MVVGHWWLLVSGWSALRCQGVARPDAAGCRKHKMTVTVLANGQEAFGRGVTFILSLCDPAVARLRPGYPLSLCCRLTKLP